MKKIWFNWSKPVKIVSIICICLSVILLGGCVVNTFVDIEDGKISIGSDTVDKLSGTKKARNDQNLLDPEYYTELIEEKKNGVEISVNEDGSITLDGIVTSETLLKLYTVKDTDCYGFTYTVGAVDFGKDADDSDLYWEYTGLSDSYSYDIPAGSAVTFTIGESAGADCNFYIRLARGDFFDNVTIYPTLNYGYVSQSYYEKASLFDGVFDSFDKDRNPGNMLYPNVYESIDGKHNGVKVTVNEDGSITLDGEAAEDVILTLGSFVDSDIAGQKMAVGRVDFGEDAPGSYLKWDYDDAANNADSVYKIPVGYDFFFSPFFTYGSAPSDLDFHLNIVITAGDSFDNVTIYPILNNGIAVIPYFD